MILQKNYPTKIRNFLVFSHEAEFFKRGDKYGI